MTDTVASTVGAAAVAAAVAPAQAQAPLVPSTPATQSEPDHTGLTGPDALAKLAALVAQQGGGVVAPAPTPPAAPQTVTATAVAAAKRLFHELHPAEQTAINEIRAIADKLHSWLDRITVANDARSHLVNAVASAESAITTAPAKAS